MSANVRFGQREAIVPSKIGTFQKRSTVFLKIQRTFADARVRTCRNPNRNKEVVQTTWFGYFLYPLLPHSSGVGHEAIFNTPGDNEAVPRNGLLTSEESKRVHRNLSFGRAHTKLPHRAVPTRRPCHRQQVGTVEVGQKQHIV